MSKDRKYPLLSYSSTRLAIATGAVFIIASLFVVLLVFFNQRSEALAEAEAKALIILNRNLATHAYFNKELKPKLFNWTTPFMKPHHFEPTWMSSTYAIREIDRQFQSISQGGYYYKECAINARSPQNEADLFEHEFVQLLNTDASLEKKSGVREIDGKPYFYVLRRGEIMEEGCMRCHSDPSQAPGEMVSRYGSERSFHRAVGAVVSAISIRIPLDEAYTRANRLALTLSGLLLAVLLLLFVTQFWLSRRLVFSPLSSMRDKALQITQSNTHLGEAIPVPPSSDLGELASAFNKMSASLRETVDQLETRVKERTAELESVNARLVDDIARREKLEEERERIIQQLQDALGKVKTLSGMLPICASCKKIRDDKGYWSQVEVYVKERTDAEFSHGICPECAKKAYQEIDQFVKENKTGKE